MKATLLPLFLVLPATAPADVVFSEVDLTGNRIELINTGPAAIDFTGLRWCNFITGFPRYGLVTTYSTVDAGLSSPGAVLTNFGVGQVMVLNITDPQFLSNASGELGLYTSTAWTSPSAIVDYILWGANGTRDSVAQGAGIWIDNDEIVVTGLGAGETIQLKLGAPGNSAADYEIAPATLGVAQSLAPVEIGISSSGFLDADTFFLEFTYNGSGTLKVTESTTLSPGFTDVSARTTVSIPTPGRFEFDVAGNALFFRLEEE